MSRTYNHQITKEAPRKVKHCRIAREYKRAKIRINDIERYEN